MGGWWSQFPSLDKVVFSNNTAIQKGGAFYTIGGSGGTSSSHLTDVIFSGNHAGVSGGAIYVRGVGTHRLDITKATFSTNSADDWGGAITHYCTNGSCNPTWREITFSGNWAGENGGAVGNYCGGISTCNPTLINVVFSGNSAGSKGGAMENFSDDISESKPILVNVTFSGNFAGINGGAMYNRIDRTMEWGDTNPELRNCILWRNYGQSGTTLREDGSGRISVDVIDNILNEYGAKVTLKNSLLQGSGGSSDWISDGGYVDGKNNIDIDPKFVMSVDPFKAPTTDGNLRLNKFSGD